MELAIEWNDDIKSPLPIPPYAGGPRSGRIWSLWDMLENLNTSDIASSFSYLGGTIKYLQLAVTQMFETRSSAVVIQQEQYVGTLDSIRRLQTIAEKMHMTAAASAATRAFDTLMQSYSPKIGYDLDHVSAIVNTLIPLLNSFSDELKSRLVLWVLPQHAAFYQPDASVFGRAVEQKFPQAVEDISEAGKCLAVEQSTATVFHLMRAMEIAIQGLSAKLDIENREREWGKLLSDIARRIEAMPKGSLRDQWSEVSTYLYHVKQAWRNSTMHPKQTYTMDEAESIFSAVKAFMNSLAALV